MVGQNKQSVPFQAKPYDFYAKRLMGGDGAVRSLVSCW